MSVTCSDTTSLYSFTIVNSFIVLSTYKLLVEDQTLGIVLIFSCSIGSNVGRSIGQSVSQSVSRSVGLSVPK